MSKKQPHKSTLFRRDEIRNLIPHLYEEGNQSKCYAAVWRSRIYPTYGICYRTFLRYVKEIETKQVNR